jgi:hypothetical protein
MHGPHTRIVSDSGTREEEIRCVTTISYGQDEEQGKGRLARSVTAHSLNGYRGEEAWPYRPLPSSFYRVREEAREKQFMDKRRFARTFYSGLIDWLYGVRLTSQNCGHHWPIVHPPGECECRSRWWCRLGITPNSCTRTLWQSYQQRHLKRVGGMDEGMSISRISIFRTSTDLLHAVKSYDMGPPALLPIRRKVCCGFLSPLKIHRLGRVYLFYRVFTGFTATLRSSGKHTNHYTTEATSIREVCYSILGYHKLHT